MPVPSRPILTTFSSWDARDRDSESDREGVLPGLTIRISSTREGVGDRRDGDPDAFREKSVIRRSALLVTSVARNEGVVNVDDRNAEEDKRGASNCSSTPSKRPGRGRLERVDELFMHLRCRRKTKMGGESREVRGILLDLAEVLRRFSPSYDERSTLVVDVVLSVGVPTSSPGRSSMRRAGAEMIEDMKRGGIPFRDSAEPRLSSVHPIQSGCSAFRLDDDIGDTRNYESREA
ncbi:hypothetical protein R3P38DRAFT_2779696 [Favolaschia claudopus]|uniref:Uncharacterized protein n=1 Tax=Favolaschia claudopus TaxID=2862362 RepID=A0AAW0BBG8_9AGAR